MYKSGQTGLWRNKKQAQRLRPNSLAIHPLQDGQASARHNCLPWSMALANAAASADGGQKKGESKTSINGEKKLYPVPRQEEK